MECNKDEAVRAKEIAENKLTEMDFAGAKKFALKAQNLFPGLEGLPQFMETLDVYISAEKKIDGEVDWYGVLGVSPLADDETLRRHYRKLALSLHPDKNKSVGADGAFKILSEAWTLLSDKAKKVEYNRKLNIMGMYQKNTTGNASGPGGKNGFHVFTHQNTPNVNGQKPTDASQPSRFPPRPSKPNTFWTGCNGCKMQFEYLRDYLNQNLRCPNCQEPFCAVEIPAPSRNGLNSSNPWPSYHKQQPNVNHHIAKTTVALGKKPISVSNVGPLGSARSVPGLASSVGRNTNVFHQSSETLKRGREEIQTTVLGEEAARRKNSASKKTGARLSSNAGGSTSGKGDRPMKRSRIEVNVTGTERPSTSGTVKHNSAKELSESQLELRNFLVAKSKMEITTKLNELSTEAALKAPNNKAKMMEMETPKASVNGGKEDGKKDNVFVDPRKSPLPPCNIDSEEKAAEVMLMSVPDPDFYNFDKDRVETSFGENQVWAAYDDDDGMPRYYALIHGVISKRPFKIRISWLNSKTTDELGPLNWVGSGFFKTTGDFRIGKHVINKNLNSFSHRVKWMKVTRGAIQIFPKKGDVWALYRNWSPDWNELTPDEVVHKYDVVEVLEDYNEERDVVVAPLVKVAGFKSVFHQHLGPGQMMTIPRKEMFRFSHHVPSYILTGQEGRNAPKGCLELDPAALPLELLQVITEAQEVETAEKAKVSTEDEKAKEDLHVEESGKSNTRKWVNEHFKNVYKRKAKESKEEHMVKNTSEVKE